MAKKKDGTSKSQFVRALLKSNPKMNANDVVAALGEKGIKVTASLVYFLKGKAKGKRGRRKKARQQVAAVAATMSNGKAAMIKSDTLATILKVKGLAGEVGGMKQLKALVEALS